MAEDREITAARGRRAAQLLDDDLIKGAFEQLEQSYSEAWKSTTIDNVAGREKLFLAINIVGKVRAHLELVAANGRLADDEIKSVFDAAERKKRFGIL